MRNWSCPLPPGSANRAARRCRPGRGRRRRSPRLKQPMPSNHAANGRAGRRSSRRTSDAMMALRPPPWRASNQVPRAVGAQLSAPAKPSARKLARTLRHSTRMPQTGAGWRQCRSAASLPRPRPPGVLQQRHRYRMQGPGFTLGRAFAQPPSGTSMRTPPRRIPACTPAAAAGADRASTTLALLLLLDQLGQNTSSGNWGK